MPPNPLPRLGPILAAVALLAGGAVTLAFVGVRITRQHAHLHLVFNLVLAFLPLAFALLAAHLDLAGRPRWAAVLGLPWLLFLPNSPYLFTDFIHLRYSPPLWIWGHLLLLVWFSFAGLAAGLLSLRLIHHHLERHGRPLLAWTVVLGAAALSGLGVALGRFQRWHSWDLFLHPRSVVGDALRNAPFGHTPLDASVAVGMGLFMIVAYAFFRVLTPPSDRPRP